MIVLSPFYRWLHRRQRRKGRYKVVIQNRGSVGPSFRRDLTTSTWQSSDRAASLRRRRRVKAVLLVLFTVFAIVGLVWLVRESIRGLELY